jgi:ubiquitin-protein ligase
MSLIANHINMLRFMLATERETSNIRCYVNSNNMKEIYFEWTGIDNFEGGKYYGIVELCNEYPFKPPKVKMFTPSGKFEVNKYICLSNTHFHTESWSPMWNIYIFLVGFISIFTDDKEKGIAHIKTEDSLKKGLANSSIAWNDNNLSEMIAYKCFKNNVDVFPSENDKKKGAEYRVIEDQFNNETDPSKKKELQKQLNQMKKTF